VQANATKAEAKAVGLKRLELSRASIIRARDYTFVFMIRSYPLLVFKYPMTKVIRNYLTTLFIIVSFCSSPMPPQATVLVVGQQMQ
jgi:hypothetical protein